MTERKSGGTGEEESGGVRYADYKELFELSYKTVGWVCGIW